MKRLLIVIAAIVGLVGFETVQQAQTHVEKKASVRTVGILQLMRHPALDAIHAGIVDGLKERGYVVGKNLKIDYQNAQNDQSNLMTMSQRFEQEKVDAMVGIATPSAQALANVSHTRPVILGAVTDPMHSGLVKDNAHPGGNVTGVSDRAPLAAELELIQRVMPNLKTIGVIATSSDDSAQTQSKEFTALAKKAGLNVKTYSLSSTNELAAVSARMASDVEAVFVPTDNTLAGALPTLIKETNKKRVPVFPTVETMVQGGGLATVGLDQHELGVMTGKRVADVLDGKKPANLPIVFATKGELIVNQKQAKVLGMTLPESVLKDARKNGKVLTK